MMRNSDASVVALFKSLPFKNEALTAKAGRPIYEDREVVELRYPGSRNVGVFPSTAMSHWDSDPETGEQHIVTYAERFPRQYQQFKAQATQTKTGTPLMYANFITEARKAELRALNIYTVEALASIDGHELKNLGMGGREMKNKAMEYLEESKTHAVDTQMAAELEALRARNSILEEDAKFLKANATAPIDKPEDQFESMDLDQIREFIATNTGQTVLGGMNRKTLLRLARDAATEKV
jgi:hypothetical protein